MEVAILKDGTAVSLGNSFMNKAFDIDGFLLEFIYIDQLGSSYKYKYFQKSSFREVDKNSRKSLNGYYNELEYLRYVQQLEANAPTLENLLSKYKFDFNIFRSKVNDLAVLKVVHMGMPFDFYYNYITYTFPIEASLPNSKISKNYLKPIFENLRLIRSEIDFPNNAVKSIEPVVPVNLATRYFYNNNFSRYLMIWLVPDVTKRNIKRMVTLVTFRIAEINNDIFSKIASAATMTFIDGKANLQYDDTNSLTDFEKMIFILKKSWGYYYNPDADSTYIHKHSFEPLFSGNPDYDEYVKYYEALSSFYYGLYKIQDKLLNVGVDHRLRYLLQILPDSALSLIPFSIIKKQLSGYSRISKLDQSSQRYIVRLVVSITKRVEFADEFLDFLLLEENGQNTTFQVLYNLLDDARLERLTIVNWFVDEQTNRKYYAYAINELWKVSKYNWDYFPPNTSPPPSPGSINPDSYFLSKDYNPNNVFEFGTVVIRTYDNNKTLSEKATKFFSKLNSKKISIGKAVLIMYKDGLSIKSSDWRYDELGDFHLYHPVCLVGYQSNFDLEIPEKSAIPAFLFFFAEEYDQLADFDAGISLAIDTGIDISLFFASGGVTILRDLKYLRYLTDLGKALRGELPVSQAVTVWRASEISSEAITLAAGAIVNFNHYLEVREDDEEKKKHHRKIQWIFLGLILPASIGTVYSRVRAVKEANLALELIYKFPGTTHGVPADIFNLLETLAGKRAVLSAEMGNKLQTLKNEGLAVDNVIEKFSSFSLEQKYRFWQNFEKINDKKIWEKLNYYDGDALDNWLALSERGIMEATNISFITSPKRVQAIIKYYDVPGLRSVLESFDYRSRLRLLDEFIKKNLIDDAIFFDKIIQKPNSLELIRVIQSGIKTGDDVFTFKDVIKIIKAEFKSVTVDYLTIKSTTILKEVVKRYIKEIANETIDINRLRSLYDGTAEEFADIFSHVGEEKIETFLGSNKLVAKTEVRKKNGTLVKFLEEYYISGRQDNVLELFGGSIPSSLKEPFYPKFNVFKKKAYDFVPRERENDTEIKYIFNLLENHWDDGDNFIITLESTLYTCESCQGYLVYLKELAKRSGKTVEIRMIANSYAVGTPELRTLLNL